MTKVRFTTVTEVLMDEFSQVDIIEMGNNIGSAGKNDIEGVCQGVEVLSIKAMPVIEEIDCLAVEEKETATNI